MALGSTHLLTEMSTRNIFWGKGGRVFRTDKLSTYICRWSRKSDSLYLLQPSGPVQACIRIALPLHYLNDFLLRFAIQSI
jgi:hypothetical protein